MLASTEGTLTSTEDPLKRVAMLSQPLLVAENDMGGREQRPKPMRRMSVMDGLGTSELREVTIDELKGRFFTLGLQVGVATQLFVISVVIMLVATDEGEGTFQPAVYELFAVYYCLFRAIFLACFFFCCYGMVLFAWKRQQIDYLQILGVGHEHNYHFIIQAAFTRMSLVFFCFVLYVFKLRSPNSWFLPNKHVLPATALLGTAVLSLWPRDSMPQWKDRSQRYALIRALGRLLLSPLFPVAFSSTFIADVLTSMPKIFTDMLATLCLYASGAALTASFDVDKGEMIGIPTQCTSADPRYQVASFVLSVFPFWIRLMQCVRGYLQDHETRHVANGLKYCVSIAVVVLSFWGKDDPTLKTIWFALAVCSTLFAYAWDIKMDWGHPALCAAADDDAPDVPRRYPLWTYNVAAGTNALARLGWAVYISPNQKVVQQHMLLLLGCVELMRRAQWAAFRVEWEQHKMDVRLARYGIERVAPRFRTSTVVTPHR